MKLITKLIFNIVFFSGVLIFLMAFTLFLIFQGIISQLQGLLVNALLQYIFGFASAATSLLVYIRARKAVFIADVFELNPNNRR